MQTATVSPDRWTRALERARAEGIRLQRGADAGTFRVISGSHTYTATADACTCLAGQHGDDVCKHRAAVRSALRLSARSASVPCVACAASGWVWMNPETVRCERCDGTGHVPALRLVVVNDPDPEPPAPASELDQLRRERERAWNALERFSARIERGDVLSDREWRAFEIAQERERATSERIAELAGKAAA